MSLLLLLLRLFLAGTFAVAGAAKLADLAGSRQAMRDFGVPAKLADISGGLLPLVELATAVALVVPPTAWWGAVAAFSLLLIFVAGIGYNLAQGRHARLPLFWPAPLGSGGLVHTDPQSCAGRRCWCCRWIRKEHHRARCHGVAQHPNS